MLLRPAGLLSRGLLSLCLLAPSATALAEEASPAAQKPRPRVALVLSGGGARGLAHVGVFKALEKMRVPYDCIVGTSMGAIAGGTFATGQPVAMVEQRVINADWEAIFADKSRRVDTPYFRKYEDFRPYFDFTLNLDHLKPLTPRNFVGVQHIGLFFRELTDARAVKDFDRLPVPYRAVGTDIISGEAVVIDEGTVAEAMRASMTVPGVFPPIEYKGHLLVDGGLAKNIPVSVGQKLCGDVVIAVNVSSPNLTVEELTSFLSIGQQVVNISMQANMNEELARLRPQDILLVPDLAGYSSTDFPKARELIRRGEKVVEANAERLRPLQVGEAEYAAWRARIDARVAPPPVVERVEMTDMRWVNEAVLSDLLNLRTGEPFDMPALHRNISRVYARGDFSKISYDLLPTGRDKATLRIEPEEKPGRDFARVGLELFSDFQGDTRFNLQASLRRAWLNRLDAQWRTDIRVGSDLEAYSEWYQPASLGSEFFVAPHVFYVDQFRDLRFSSSARYDYEYTSTGAGLEVGSVFGRWGEVRAGIMTAYASVESGFGPAIPEESYHQGGYTLRTIYDQLDSTFFPHRGGAARLNLFRSSPDLDADLAYDRAEFWGMRAYSSDDTTLLLKLRAGSSVNTALPFYDAFRLGGIFNLSAYPTDYFLGEEMLMGGVHVYHRIGDLPSGLGRGVYAGTVLEAANMWELVPGYESPEGAVSGSLYLAADTVLGPFYLLGAVGDNKQRAIYMALGISY